LARAVEQCRPAFVVHAAFVNRKPVGSSDSAYLEEMVSVNLPLFQACARSATRLLLISSSAVYGLTGDDDGRAIDESCSLSPVSLYGTAKLVQEVLARYLAASAGLQLCIVRLFNICGPGQRPGMLVPDWVKGVAAIARGAEPTLRVLNRSTSRDFVDVRDAARAISLLLADFRAGEVVNVASSCAITLKDLSTALARLCPVPFDVVETAPIPATSDVLAQRGSYAHIHANWGWSPRIDFWQSLRDVWEEWYSETGSRR
jgi:GDP-4-dehydro-6-deoxy-D-mannose reductase